MWTWLMHYSGAKKKENVVNDTQPYLNAHQYVDWPTNLTEPHLKSAANKRHRHTYTDQIHHQQKLTEPDIEYLIRMCRLL